jgi:hypothetical protein
MSSQTLGLDDPAVARRPNSGKHYIVAGKPLPPDLLVEFGIT